MRPQVREGRTLPTLNLYICYNVTPQQKVSHPLTNQMTRQGGGVIKIYIMQHLVFVLVKLILIFKKYHLPIHTCASLLFFFFVAFPLTASEITMVQQVLRHSRNHHEINFTDEEHFSSLQLSYHRLFCRFTLLFLYRFSLLIEVRTLIPRIFLDKLGLLWLFGLIMWDGFTVSFISLFIIIFFHEIIPSFSLFELSNLITSMHSVFFISTTNIAHSFLPVAFNPTNAFFHLFFFFLHSRLVAAAAVRHSVSVS